MCRDKAQLKMFLRAKLAFILEFLLCADIYMKQRRAPKQPYRETFE